MKFIDPKNNTDLENYKLLIGSVIPRPIAFITSISGEGVVNAAPFSYFNIVSSAPPLVSIAILREKEEPKDTLKNILEKKEFVLHLVNSENVENINKASINFAPDKSEVEFANLTLVESTNVSVPGVLESRVRFECTLENHFEIKDNGKTITDLVIGRIVGFQIDEEVLFDGKIDPLKLDPIARLAGRSYSKLGEIFDLKRPRL
ncbi:MAG: flavin reductase family protein [Bacilli bacterium]